MKKIRLSTLLSLTLMLSTLTIARATTEPTWVVMRGRVDYYGANGAFGWCGVLAEIREWAQAFAAWSPWGGPQIPEICNFYAARLANTTVVELDYSGADLYIEGLWDVYNVTFIYEPGVTPGNYTLTIELLVDHGEGTLSVTGGWTDFTVGITGINLVRGKVTFYAIRPIEIPIGDVVSVPGEEKPIVNIWDLVHVAKAYGSTPRIPADLQNFSMDFNFDFKVDIVDLTTIAVNIGKSY